jgi:hypothetical protein
MTFKDELQSLDPVRMSSVVESMIDKGNARGGVAAQKAALWQEFPALQAEYDSLMDYLGTQLSAEEMRVARITATAALLALREYAEVDEMRQQFPDAPDAHGGYI